MSSMFKEDPVFKATPESIGSLVVAIQKGLLALPDFQRSFVWEPKRTIELLKSIISRYPAGTLLTWEQSTDIQFGSRPFEGAPETPDKQPRRLVLDGQQRLTSLYQALTGTGDYKFFVKVWPFIDRERGELRPLEEVDLENAIFAHDGNRRARFNPLDGDWQLEEGVFPLSEYDRLRPWFKSFSRKVEQDRDAADQLEELLHQLRDTYLQPLESYAFPVVDLPEQTSLVAVCNIFETLNRSGKVLGPFELLTAKFYPSGVKLRDLWDVAQQEYPSLVEFNIDPYSLLQVICLRSHASAQRYDVLNRLTAADIEQHWDAVIAAAAEIVDMLKRECGAISPQWLPYGMALVPMAAVYPEISHLKSHFRSGAREKLRQYYWCTVFSENYDQGANSQAGADFKLLRNWVIGQSEKAPEAVEDFSLTDADLLSARANRKALFRGFVTLLIQAGAKDADSAQAYSSMPVAESSLDTVRVFPKSWLSIPGNNPEGFGPELILNRVIVYRSTRRSVKDNLLSDYIDSQEPGTQRKYLEVLDSHLIDSEPDGGFQQRDYAKFLRERLSRLVEEIENVTGQSVIYDSEL